MSASQLPTPESESELLTSGSESELPTPGKRPSMLRQFRGLLANDTLPVSTRLIFGITFLFGLLWSLKIALTNLLWG